MRARFAILGNWNGCARGGLSAAKRKRDGALRREPRTPVGHTATTRHPTGFLFDKGPHVSFTKDERIQGLFAESVKGEYEAVQYSLNNYWQGHWITHPCPVQPVWPAIRLGHALPNFVHRRGAQSHAGGQELRRVADCKLRQGDRRNVSYGVYAEISHDSGRELDDGLDGTTHVSPPSWRRSYWERSRRPSPTITTSPTFATRPMAASNRTSMACAPTLKSFSGHELVSLESQDSRANVRQRSTRVRTTRWYRPSRSRT